MGKSFRVKHKVTGAIYVLGPEKFESEKDMWELCPREDVVQDDELTYDEMRKKLKDLGVEFKGNASKADLKKLLEES